MLEQGVSESQAQVCAFMGIGSNEQEMIPLNLEAKVRLIHSLCADNSGFDDPRFDNDT